MKNKTLIQVLIAISLAFVVGLLSGTDSTLFDVPLVRYYELIGQLFLNALTLVVIPLVASSIVTGTAKMAGEKSFSSLGLKTFGFFLLTTFLAVLVGVILVTAISPGSYQDPATVSVSRDDMQKIHQLTHHAEGGTFEKFENMLYKIIPENILAVASKNQMLGLIVFSLVFGFFISRIEPEPGSIVLEFFRGIFQIMMSMTHFVMKALPIGVFGLVAHAVATTGLQGIASIAMFFVTAVLAFCVFMLIVLPLLLKFVAKVKPFPFIKGMAPAIFTAFSTSSSAATLPVTIECIEKRIGVSNRICSFTVPLGATLNFTGTALYSSVVVIFIAQVYGIHITLPMMIIVVLMSLLTSFGMAGIPSAGLISIVIILHTVGLPEKGIGMILATERILDMCRTIVNAFGNASCSLLVARSEGEKTLVDR